ncbi:hypothetical protein RJ640_014374 [Escallonia rubra]|uniref:BHLH domain-containing protein n=1 Tax=Escallonia rubra TaxID=112253 RepID=A0AA88U882_9ASTE|nr:hypothetical protein RJ640_014374 [Escallonia rubra]
MDDDVIPTKIVGEVAYTGNCCWLFSDQISTGQLNSELVPKCPDEWLFQFAGGIKTLLLVPVFPHGVLQLGSLEKVSEDLALVAYIKEKFIAYQNYMGYFIPFIEDGEFQVQLSSSVMSPLMTNLEESSAVTMNDIQSQDSKAVDHVKPQSHSMNQIIAPCEAWNSIHESRNDMMRTLDSVTANDISLQIKGFIEEPKQLYQSVSCNKLENLENNIFGLSCLEEELHALSYTNNCNRESPGEYANKMMKSCSDRDIRDEVLADKDGENTGDNKVSSSFSFPRDSELHKALGLALKRQTSECLWNSSVSGEAAVGSSTLISSGDISCATRPSSQDTNGAVKRDDAKHLLEAVVVNVHCTSDDNSSNITNSIKSSTASSGQVSGSSKEHSHCERSAVGGEDTAPQSCVTSAFIDRERYGTTNSSFRSAMCALIEQQQQQHRYNLPQARKGSKLSSASKRRARPGDQKPRPRDRQLIQDRVKELRDLVPNGAKCSIDGLLERTVKHMLFLRSVTDQADKLKQWVPREAGCNNLKQPETDDAHRSGKSWVCELGSEQQICPIVVEDLEYPGHMLIEMACNDHGRFLEIAEVIHRLELTILKGVMERRSDESWAHFIVEVPRGFHRLDIFWPLMQLLQQNRSPISSKI